MTLPFHMRKFQTFFGSTNSNRDVVEPIKHWLTDKAGIVVLDDLPRFLLEDSSENRLENALALCQSIIIWISRQRVESGQVKREFELGLKQQTATDGLFRIVPICIEDCIIPEFLHLSACIDLNENGLDLAMAVKLLLGLYSNGIAAEEGRSHDVFISRPWSMEEDGLTSLACKTLKQLGFRLIGNVFDQSSKPNALSRLVSGCGGGVAVIPNGISERATKKIIYDLEIMSNLGLPFIIISESSIKIPDNVTNAALQILRLEANPMDSEKQVYNTALMLQEEWVNPPEYKYIFYGTDLKDEHKIRNRLLQKAVRHIASLPCLMGEDIQRGHIQSEIIDLIVHAQMMIADISKENLNTCIEAGVAIGANVPLNLLSGDERHKPPFMFRDRQIWHYQNDLDLLGIIHKLVIPYRRYIL